MKNYRELAELAMADAVRMSDDSSRGKTEVLVTLTWAQINLLRSIDDRLAEMGDWLPTRN